MAVDVHALCGELDSSRENARALVHRARRVTEESRRLRSRSQGRRLSACPVGWTQTDALVPSAFSPGVVRQAGAGPLPAVIEAERLRRENAQLRQALAGRPVVDQARGVLMAVGGCGPELAWEALVETSQRTNTKLRRVAEMVVASAAGGNVPDPVAAQLRQSLARHTAAQ
ncbi:ANTAR domain-containing protein [Streptomyces longisporoflavus]|uniref:ANTAR domain-containing protein n=1 Tax=Streptomyces longisporoflavus TaxID=28044 RepID=A0ABW7R8D5_9ACTN